MHLNNKDQLFLWWEVKIAFAVSKFKYYSKYLFLSKLYDP